MRVLRFRTKLTRSISGQLCCLVATVQSLPVCCCLVGVCPKTALGIAPQDGYETSNCECRCRRVSKHNLASCCCDSDASQSDPRPKVSGNCPQKPCYPCECRIQRTFFALKAEAVKRSFSVELTSLYPFWIIDSFSSPNRFSIAAPLVLAQTACQRLAWLGCWLK
jgi:hypothetical protein